MAAPSRLWAEMAAEGFVLDQEGCLKSLVRRLTDDSIIQTGDTLQELRIKRGPLARRVWSAAWVADKVPEIEKSFEVFGTHTSFLLRPNRAVDYTGTDQKLRNTVTGLQVGDGTTATFQLEITRTLGSKSGSKKIMHPISPLTELRVDATVLAEGIHYSVDYLTGIVTFLAGSVPAAGQIPDADFVYDTPVRWLSDHVETRVTQAYGVEGEVIEEINQADLIEVFDE
jgi:uncharacterized protein (TIGR02217 family)